MHLNGASTPAQTRKLQPKPLGTVTRLSPIERVQFSAIRDLLAMTPITRYRDACHVAEPVPGIRRREGSIHIVQIFPHT